MNATNSIINTKGLDIAKAQSFANFVAAAKQMQNALDEAWGLVEQQMIDRGVTKVQGDWGTVSLEDMERLVIADATQLDPAVTKPALDTTKVRAYRKLMGDLPAGVATAQATRFVKRIKG